jgi:hypothetical protein
VYELATNEIADDYSDLEQLIKTINHNPTGSQYLAYLDTIFNVNEYLKTYALDILTGNWDNYAYNSNNYYLYNDSGLFRFITFDTDNTFGIDWSNINWATRPIKNWYHETQPRPLIHHLLNHAAANQKFLFYIDSLRKHITHPDSVFHRLDTLRDLLLPHVAADSFKSLDYGYTEADYLQGFVGAVDNHSPIGIKPFLQIRYQTAIPLYIEDEQAITPPLPNPAWNSISMTLQQSSTLTIVDVNGRVFIHKLLEAGKQHIDISDLAVGTYILRLDQKNGKRNSWIIFKE